MRTTESVVALLDGKGVGLVLEMSRQDVHEEADEVRGRLEDEREQRQTDEHLTRTGPHAAVSFASIARHRAKVCVCVCAMVVVLLRTGWVEKPKLV